MIRNFISIAIVIAIIAIIAALINPHTSGAKCTNAGYTDAQFELCVKRVVKGGPVYEENIGKY